MQTKSRRFEDKESVKGPLHILACRKQLIIGGTLLCIAIAEFTAWRFVPSYEARLTFEMGKIWNKSVQENDTTLLLLQNPSYQYAVLSKRGFKDPQAYGRFRVRPQAKKGPIALSVKGDDEREVKEFADALVKEMLERTKSKFTNAKKMKIRLEENLRTQLQITEAEVKKLNQDLSKAIHGGDRPALDLALFRTHLTEKLSYLTELIKLLSETELQNSLLHTQEGHIIDGPYLFNIRPAMLTVALFGALAGLALTIAAVLLIET